MNVETHSDNKYRNYVFRQNFGTHEIHNIEIMMTCSIKYVLFLNLHHRFQQVKLYL